MASTACCIAATVHLASVQSAGTVQPRGCDCNLIAQFSIFCPSRLAGSCSGVLSVWTMRRTKASRRVDCPLAQVVSLQRRAVRRTPAAAPGANSALSHKAQRQKILCHREVCQIAACAFFLNTTRNPTLIKSHNNHTRSHVRMMHQRVAVARGRATRRPPTRRTLLPRAHARSLAVRNTRC